MYVSKNKHSKKGWVYYIRDQRQGKKGGYLKQDDGQIISFDSRESAERFIQSKMSIEAKNSTAIRRIEEWQAKFPRIEDNFLIFYEHYKTKAKYTHSKVKHYFYSYIFEFFLTQRGKPNMAEWKYEFLDFKAFLGRAKTTRIAHGQGGRTISRATANQIINSLNNFLAFLADKAIIEPQPKCKLFPSSELGVRTVEHVVTEDEYLAVLKGFDAQKPGADASDLEMIDECKAFYKVLYHTGLRLSEGLGLSLSSYLPFPPKGVSIIERLEKHGLNIIGYINLEDQLESLSKAGKVKRKPLKSKTSRDSRQIPIWSKECNDALEELAVKAVIDFNLASHDDDHKGEYLLFRRLTKNIVSSRLRLAYSKMSLEDQKLFSFKSMHCLRHTFSTRLIEMTYDPYLLQVILGHKSKVYEKYVHLTEQLKERVTRDTSPRSFYEKANKLRQKAS